MFANGLEFFMAQLAFFGKYFVRDFFFADIEEHAAQTKLPEVFSIHLQSSAKNHAVQSVVDTMGIVVIFFIRQIVNIDELQVASIQAGFDDLNGGFKGSEDTAGTQVIEIFFHDLTGDLVSLLEDFNRRRTHGKVLHQFLGQKKFIPLDQIRFMNEIWNWNNLRLFLSVARLGGLAKAVPIAQVSAPTLGRRMVSLERALGTTLFVRRRDGYELTTAGTELLELAEAIEVGALGIERWRTAADPHPIVKIAAGEWTSAFIARNMSNLIENSEEPAIEILTGAAPADLLRREANLGLRNRRPETPGLAGRRLVRVEFAIYGEAALVRNCKKATEERRFAACHWIAFSPPGPKVASAVWLDRRLRREARLRCSTAQAVLEAALAGLGLCVLPYFIGDTEPNLARASGIIAELGHEQWLVSHDDDRQNKHIKQVSNRLSNLIRAHEKLFNGELGNQISN
jgi:DNA-binding transcriptional LysR family regulator